MICLGDIEKLAQDEIDDPITRTKQRDYRGAMRAYHLARALLRIAPVLRTIHDDLDSAVAAHDLSDPRHPSHGGQHTNGRCCAFGNVNPSAVIHMRRLRDAIDEALSAATRGLEGE